MTTAPTDEKQKEAAIALLKEMETTATRMRQLIVAMPAEDLLGYIYAQYLMKALKDQKVAPKKGDPDGLTDLINENQFLLEYVHAVLASSVAPEYLEFDESKCAELFELSRNLRVKSMLFAMASSVNTLDGAFGPDTADIEFHAKSTWVLLRGNRAQVLEGEFYNYVLAPHDDVLMQIYGSSASEIAAGFQAMADATRSGQANALEVMDSQFKAAHDYAAKLRRPFEEVSGSWLAENVERAKTAGLAFDDLLRGGIANVSRHTKLPEKLLADLAYERGEDAQFFAVGDFSGTPFRTLPARKKPLIKLKLGYYAVDPCFIRDAGYRALLYNLLQREPAYKKTFEDRQKKMSEGAFADILAVQLPKATVHQEVYYKDPVSQQWCENDTLVMQDDVLFLIEAKAGAAATIASPALDFTRHAQSVQELVLKAYKQCDRFFNYLNSSDEVPIYQLKDGKYEESGRIRRSDFRLMIPIGLTVESFSPFSTFCKDLPQVVPLLGKHAFISISIDELFVLKRFLPTPGIFAHYMEVRQAVAGLRRAHLFDEYDHLGAYTTKNRFDLDIVDQLKDGKADMLVWDGMSNIIDKSFESEDWNVRPIPTQEFPNEVLKLLDALDTTRARGWLSAESHIRNFGEQARKNLGKMLSELGKSLVQHPVRYFTIVGDGLPLFVWLQSAKHNIESKNVHDKASASALCTRSPDVVGLMVEVSASGAYSKAERFAVHIPSNKTGENAHIYDDAERMSEPSRTVDISHSVPFQKPIGTVKTGRNQACPCGSGVKYKRCHGR